VEAGKNILNPKVVCSIEFPDGSMEYVIWEPELYGQMKYSNVDIRELFYNTSKNGFTDAPVDVLIEMYDDPKIQEISQTTGEKQGLMQLLIGRKIFPIERF